MNNEDEQVTFEIANIATAFASLGMYLAYHRMANVPGGPELDAFRSYFKSLLELSPDGKEDIDKLEFPFVKEIAEYLFNTIKSNYEMHSLTGLPVWEFKDE